MSSTARDVEDLKRLCNKFHRTLETNVQSRIYPMPHTQHQTQPGTSYTSRTRTGSTRGGRYKMDQPNDLGYATVMRLRGGSDAACLEGANEWNDWYMQHQAYKAKDWKESEMIGLAGILSKIFFLDELRHLVQFEWKQNLAGEDATFIVFGSFTHKPPDELSILIDPTDYHERKKMATHGIAIISTFLHELTHSYLHSFCYDGTDEHKEGHCRRGHIDVWPRLGKN